MRSILSDRVVISLLNKERSFVLDKKAVNQKGSLRLQMEQIFILQSMKMKKENVVIKRSL